jgi:hypothetical protein
MMIRAAFVALFASTVACSSPARTPAQPPAGPAATSPDPAPAAADPAPPADPAEAPVLEQLTLEIAPRYLDWSAAGEVVFEEESDRMKADYRHFVFDRAEFEAEVGTEDSIKGKLQVMVDVVEKWERTHDPAEGARPMGGFQITTYRCRIASVVR